MLHFQSLEKYYYQFQDTHSPPPLSDITFTKSTKSAKNVQLNHF